MVITDPHIKKDPSYNVYKEGVLAEAGSVYHTWGEYLKKNFTSIFIKGSNGHPFEGYCWPGQSNWIDFLNENAQRFWQEKMQPSFFKGTNSRYAFWIDMNEPSVFQQPNLTMPLDNLHYASNGKSYLHRDVHNLYGSLQHKTVHKGMLIRDNFKLRPFVLTRSFYFGSQKYGAYWTGDNQEGFQEL